MSGIVKCIFHSSVNEGLKTPQLTIILVVTGALHAVNEATQNVLKCTILRDKVKYMRISTVRLRYR